MKMHWFDMINMLLLAGENHVTPNLVLDYLFISDFFKTRL